MTETSTPLESELVTLSAAPDPASIDARVTSLLAGIVAVVALLHPGFTLPVAVQAAVPSVAAVVAGVVQLVNIVTHRSVQKAAIEHPLGTPST